MDLQQLHTLLFAWMLGVLITLWGGPARGDVLEEEPNNDCGSAQIAGSADSLPLSVQGSLDADKQSDPPAYDVDFYAFSAVPGSFVRAELRGAPSGQGTLYDPFLGLLDGDCQVLALNDDSVLGLESSLAFEVPADGSFVLAASGCCDADLTGAHGQEGSYTLILAEAQAPIGSITGRLVDGSTGQPLAGWLDPYPFFELFRCAGADCFEYAAFGVPDGDGRFSITTDYNGNRLPAGTYRLAARANGFELTEFGPFDVASGEHLDLGDVALQPPPITFGDVTVCADLPASGGTCSYSVVVRNNTGTAINGLGWSIVRAYGTGSPVGTSVFAAAREQAVHTAANSSRTLSFSFRVPGGVADGAVFCTDAWFSDRGVAFLGTLQSSDLFCVVKEAGAYRALSAKAAATRIPYASALGGVHAGH